MMKVSLLVPVYGVEKYIRQCSRTLFGQTYDDIEYVFVDDCSPDNSVAVIRQVLAEYPHREQQVRIVRHDHNRGLEATRKTDTATYNQNYPFKKSHGKSRGSLSI